MSGPLASLAARWPALPEGDRARILRIALCRDLAELRRRWPALPKVYKARIRDLAGLPQPPWAKPPAGRSIPEEAG